MPRVATTLALLALACLAPSAGSAQARLPAAPPTSHPATFASDARELLWPAFAPRDALARPTLHRGHDMGLITAGIIGLSLGGIVAALIASLDLASGNCSTFGPVAGVRGTVIVPMQVECGTEPFALIPLAGSAIVGSVSFHGSVSTESVIAGNLALAPQIVGLVLLLFGVSGFAEDLVGEGDPRDASLQLAPIVSSTQIGAALTVSLR